MAGLTRNPDDELLRVIRSLESRVQTLETRRSRPAVVAVAGFDGGQALAANTFTPLDIDSAPVDPLGMVDMAANEVRVPHAGTYSVTVKAAANGSQLSGGVRLNVNGSSAHEMGDQGAFTGICLTVALSLSALDALSVDFYLTGGTSTLLIGSEMFVLRVSD